MPVSSQHARAGDLLEDQLGLRVADDGVHVEVLEHEVAQLRGRGDGDVQQVVVLAADVQDAEHPRHVGEHLVEARDVVAVVAAEPDLDHGLDRVAEGGEVDVGVDAAYDAPLPH